MEKLNFYSDGQLWEIKVIRKGIQNMYFQIKSNALVITAPYEMENDRILNFAKKHFLKMGKALLEEQDFFSIKDNTVMLFGGKMKIEFASDFKNPIKNSHLMIDKNLKNIDLKINDVYQYLKSFFLKYLQIRVRIIAQKLGFQINEINVSNKKAAWATNYLSQKKIIFSILLVHYNLETIDYVIIHELCHFTFPNHSKDFWKLVEKHCPGYKEIKLILKNN